MHKYHVLTDQGKYSNSFPKSIYFILCGLEKMLLSLTKKSYE